MAGEENQQSDSPAQQVTPMQGTPTTQETSANDPKPTEHSMAAVAQSGQPPTPEDSSTPADEPTADPGTESDLAMAIKHHKRGLVRAREFTEQVFHYFFVGCVSLLIVGITFLVPILLCSAVLALLGAPALILYSFLGTESRLLYPLYSLVTIFWTGYFFKHGWPRLRASLSTIFQRMRPTISWIGGVLGRHAEPEDSATVEGN